MLEETEPEDEPEELEQEKTLLERRLQTIEKKLEKIKIDLFVCASLKTDRKKICRAGLLLPNAIFSTSS